MRNLEEAHLGIIQSETEFHPGLDFRNSDPELIQVVFNVGSKYVR